MIMLGREEIIEKNLVSTELNPKFKFFRRQLKSLSS